MREFRSPVIVRQRERVATPYNFSNAGETGSLSKSCDREWALGTLDLYERNVRDVYFTPVFLAPCPSPSSNHASPFSVFQ